MQNSKENEPVKKIERLMVYLKVKEPTEKDKLYYDISGDKKLISLHDNIIKDESSKTQKIELDKIFEDSDDEEIIYNEICKHCIDDSIEGNNYTFISYGDSTSEKNELIVGNKKNGTKGIFHLLLSDYNEKIKENQGLCIYLSFIMVNGSTLIDLSQLLIKQKSIESLTEKELIKKYGREINVNDKDIIKYVQKIPCDNIEENTEYISNLINSLKKLEENEGNIFLSWSYFCLCLHIIGKKTKRTISTVNFLVLPGNELLTTKITNPNNAKRENIINTKNVVELSYTIEDIIRHLSTYSVNETNEGNKNRSKFMAVIGGIAFDVGNIEAQFDRKYRIIGSIYANTGLYYNTKDTLYFLFRCKKITRQKMNLDLAISFLEHDKKKKKNELMNSGRNDNIIKETKGELEEKLKIKDDQIYDLESKLKLQETKVSELNSRLENKELNLKNIRINYKKQVECLKDSLGFKGDVNILLSKDQYTKEYRYALNIRNTMKTNKAKTEIIEKLEEKIKELNKEKMRLKKILEEKENNKDLLKIINSYEKDKSAENEDDKNVEEKNSEILEKNKIIEELMKKNEELEKQLEFYNKENDDNIRLIHNLPSVIKKNVSKFEEESYKIKENNDLIKNKFIEEAKNISVKSKEERKKIIEKYENTIKQNKTEISNQNKIINEFEIKNEREKKKCIDELLRLHKSLMNITYGYKNSFKELNIKTNVVKLDIYDNNNNATRNIYMQKDNFEKILESEIKLINKKKYPLLFEQLKKKGEKILDIINKNNIEDNFNDEISQNIKEEIGEEKSVFKFFQGHEKKTEIEIENMNKDQLVTYGKKFVDRVKEIETYLDKYIQYKKGYKFSEEEELKISDYNHRLNCANDLLEEMTAKYNKSKEYIEKNNTIIDQLNKENLILKKKLNDKITMEKLTYPSFLNTQNNSSNKKKIKYTLLEFKNQAKNLKIKGKNIFGKGGTYSHFSLSKVNNKNKIDSYRCNTYKNNINITQSSKKNSFIDNRTSTFRPFSSFQQIKTLGNNKI